MLDLVALRKMKEADITDIDPTAITDATEIHVDTELPVSERITAYISQTTNPYFIKVGKVLVKMSYSETDLTANDCFERYMKTC